MKSIQIHTAPSDDLSFRSLQAIDEDGGPSGKAKANFHETDAFYHSIKTTLEKISGRFISSLVISLLVLSPFIGFFAVVGSARSAVFVIGAACVLSLLNAGCEDEDFDEDQNTVSRLD